MLDERTFVEVENLKGEIEKIEIFAEIKSEKEDKTYVLMTGEESIGEEVNISIGYIYDEEDQTKIKLVEDQEEISYVSSLINKALKEG